jgi:hypothetical protein
MGYALLADLIVAVHVAYVGFVVLGELMILAGLAFRWRWVRNRWFRLAHLIAIVFVAAEAVFDIACPLTVWEDHLRQAAGQEVAAGTFVGRWLDALLFFNLPPWVFTIAYVAFAALVLATLLLVPPHWRPALSLEGSLFGRAGRTRCSLKTSGPPSWPIRATRRA